MTHLVIANYNEPLEWLRNAIPFWTERFDLTIYIYHKGDAYNSQFIEPGEKGYPFIRRQALPNVGREGHTYLWHLARFAQRCNIEDKFIFLQGNPRDHTPPGVWDMYSSQLFPNWVFYTGPNSYRPLNSMLSCDMKGKPHHLWDLDLSGAIERINELLYRFVGVKISSRRGPTIPIQQISFSPGAQFSIGGQSVKGVPSELWQSLSGWLVEHENHGFELERLWGEIFYALSNRLNYG